MINKHTAICPNGHRVTRNSKTHTYSYCVVSYRECLNDWIVLGWASRADLAQTLVNNEQNKFDAFACDPEYVKSNWGDTLQCQILNAILN
jgi:hypothetical protein